MTLIFDIMVTEFTILMYLKRFCVIDCSSMRTGVYVAVRYLTLPEVKSGLMYSTIGSGTKFNEPMVEYPGPR